LRLSTSGLFIAFVRSLIHSCMFCVCQSFYKESTYLLEWEEREGGSRELLLMEGRKWEKEGRRK